MKNPFRRNKQDEKRFTPDDRERSIVDPLIDDRVGIPFAVLQKGIMNRDDINAERKGPLIEWARNETGLTQ